VHRAIEAHDALRHETQSPIAVIGLSLGAVLGIHVSSRRDVAAFVALAPALQPFVGRRILGVALEAIVRPRSARIRTRWQREVLRGIRATIEAMPRVSAPLLVLHSRDDDSVSIRGARLLHDRAGSVEKRLILLEGQGHVLTRAPEPELVFAPIRSFLRER
jgi:carboxylesterase